MRTSLLLLTIVGLCTTAYAGEPPKAVTQIDLSQLLSGVKEDNMASVAFVTDSSIAVGVCTMYGLECQLSLLELKNEELRTVASTRDFRREVLNLHRAPGGILAVSMTGSGYFYSADLSSMHLVEHVRSISPSGQIVLQRTKDHWQLRRVDSFDKLIRGGQDELLAFSDQVVVLRPKNALQIETIDGKIIGRFRIPGESKCPAHVHILGSDRLHVGDCKGFRIVDFNGDTKLRLRGAGGWPANPIGFEPASADGKRFLSVNFDRKVSFLRHAGEILIAITTLGMGVSDEVDNREQIRVVDTTDGSVCFDRLRSLPTAGTGAFENIAAISPSGELIAIVTDRYLSVYRLPATCGSHN